MKDAEQIYALYVQANPVPVPDLLPPRETNSCSYPSKGAMT